MAILFDDATDAGTLQSLQGKVVELAGSTQTTLGKEHTANGQHKNVSLDSVRSRTGAIVPVSAGVRWTGGPQLVAPPAVITPPALTATTHNWNPPGLATARVIEIRATGAVTLTGLAVAGPLRSERRLLTLVNQSAFAITLANFNAGSEAWQRFWFGSDYVLAAGTTVDLYYDPTTGLQAWRGPQAVTGGGGSITTQQKTRNITVVFGTGSAVITAGLKTFVSCPYTGTITGARVLAVDAAVTSGSIVIDVWKVAYVSYPPTVANTITASAKPTLSSATKSDDVTLTGWTTAVTAGDVFGFVVDSASLVKQVALQLTLVVS